MTSEGVAASESSELSHWKSKLKVLDQELSVLRDLVVLPSTMEAKFEALQGQVVDLGTSVQEEKERKKDSTQQLVDAITGVVNAKFEQLSTDIDKLKERCTGHDMKIDRCLVFLEAGVEGVRASPGVRTKATQKKR